MMVMTKMKKKKRTKKFERKGSRALARALVLIGIIIMPSPYFFIIEKSDIFFNVRSGVGGGTKWKKKVATPP